MTQFAEYDPRAWQDEGFIVPFRPPPRKTETRSKRTKFSAPTIAVTVVAVATGAWLVANRAALSPTTTVKSSAFMMPADDDEETVAPKRWSQMMSLLRAHEVIDAAANDEDGPEPFV